MQRNEKRKKASSPVGIIPSTQGTKRTFLQVDSNKATEAVTLSTSPSLPKPVPQKPQNTPEDQKQQSDEESTMMVVENELVLDLTEETEDYHVVLQRARDTVLNGDIHEFTMVSHLSRTFPVRDLADILLKSSNLESLSLFSIALSGDTEDFNVLAKILRGHKRLREVHMVDCGMLGVWKDPHGASSGSTSTGISCPIQQLPSTSLKMPTYKQLPLTSPNMPKIVAAVKSSRGGATDASTLGCPTDMSTSGGTAIMSTTAKSICGSMSISTAGDSKTRKIATALVARADAVKSTARKSEAPSVTSKASSKESKLSSKTSVEPPVPTMDAILDALASIDTLTRVELYGIPKKKFDKVSDGDHESDHRAVDREGEGDQDIPMVPMEPDDSYTYSDDDFLDDYDGDIRGIPGNGRPMCSAGEKLSLLMSPEALGTLCKAPGLTNIGLEDLNLQLEHIVLLAEALSREGCKVKELKMWGCNIDDRSSLALAKMLKINTSLEKLDVSYNHIGDEGCIAIASALHDNKTLKCLNIMGNECAEDYDKESKGGCYEALMDLLKKNDTLKDLILEPFEVDNDSTDDIPEFIIIPNSSMQRESTSSASE